MNRRAAIFTFVLWVIATMFLGGDLGRWNDDYEFNQRVPETGHFDRLSEPMEGQFWRPLFFIINPTLQTLFWDRPWVIHTIEAVAHGLAAISLCLMLRTLGLSPAGRFAPSLLFLACPIVLQTVFWAASIPTILSTAAFMLAVSLYTQWLRAGELWRAIAFVVLAACIPLLNEQPAPALAALPLIWLRERAGNAAQRCSFVRGMAPLAIGGLLCAAYLLAYLSSVPAGHPATHTTLLHARDAGPRFIRCVQCAADCITLGRGWGTLLRTGLHELAGAGFWGAACIAALAISALAWIASPRVPPTLQAAPARPLLLAAFGVSVFVLAWTPIYFITSYEPVSRLFYAPFVGAAVVLGVLIDAAHNRAASSPAARFIGRSALAAASIVGAVAMVGAQAGFRDQHRADESYAAQIRDLVPNPRPNSFFVPVRIDDPACRLATNWLDSNFHTILVSALNARMWIKHALHRSDVFCGSYSPDRAAYPFADARGLGFAFRYVARSIPEDPVGAWRVPWETIVPFEIDPLGSLRVVPRIVVERADNSDTVVIVPEGDPRWGRTCAYFDHAADAGVHPLGAWAWDSGSTVAFERDLVWTAVHPAAQLSESPDRRSLRTPLPATPAITTLYFRVTLPEGQALPLPGESRVGARVVWSIESSSVEPVHEITLTSDSVAADQRWTPITFTIPPHAGSDWMLRVSAEPVGEHTIATPLVTAGLWSARLP